MARPPLPIGTFGEISTAEVRPGVHRARARFRDFDGVTRIVTATGQTEPSAKRALKIALAERAAPSGELMSPEMRLSQVAEIWLELVAAERHVENTTVAQYRRVVENAIEPAIGKIRLREITAGRLERLILAQPSDSGRKKTKVVLGMILDAAVRDNALTTNPVRATSRLRYTKKEVRVMDDKDLAAVRSAMNTWMTTKRPGPRPNQDMPDIVTLLLATGCRIGEILALRWTDVDLAAKKPTVSINGTIKTEKGLGTYRKNKPKSDASSRELYLPRFAVDMLVRRHAEQPANDNDAVFATRKGTWHQVGNIERRWRQIRKEADLEWVTPHVFRKTVATHIDNLVDSKGAASQLGHGSEDITKEFYIPRERTAPDLSSVLQKLDKRGRESGLRQRTPTEPEVDPAVP